MAVNKKIIFRRIKSVKSTRKITKAMELVAAAKMRKATAQAEAGRPYLQYLMEAVSDVASRVEIENRLFAQTESNKSLVFIFMSDRGLCGGYNAQMIRALRRFIDEKGKDVFFETVTFGKRAALAANKLGMRLVGSYSDVTQAPSYETVRPATAAMIDDFIQGKYKEVLIAYTDYKSPMSQVPRIHRLLPLSRELPEIDMVDVETKKMSDKTFIVEPEPSIVLDKLFVHLVKSFVYHSLLEAVASEQSARRVAMQNATDAAEEMIEDLTLTFNQARQSGITQEIAEISSGKAALE